jgi:hypothetical protein
MRSEPSGRSRKRRRDCAFVATMILERLIAIARTLPSAHAQGGDGGRSRRDVEDQHQAAPALLFDIVVRGVVIDAAMEQPLARFTGGPDHVVALAQRVRPSSQTHCGFAGSSRHELVVSRSTGQVEDLPASRHDGPLTVASASTNPVEQRSQMEALMSVRRALILPIVGLVLAACAGGVPEVPPPRPRQPRRLR